MKRLWSILVAVMVVTGLTWACSETTAGGDTQTGNPTDFHAFPDVPHLTTYSAKYPNAINCPSGTTPVNEIIQHGQVWSGDASTGWLQFAVHPLEIQSQRTVVVEVYSFVGNPKVRCRNWGPVVNWTFYDGSSQTPRQTLMDTIGTGAPGQVVAFRSNGWPDGIQILTSDGLWEIGRDRYIAWAAQRQLSDGSLTFGTVADTIIVDAVLTYPDGCQPNTGVNCQP